MTSIESAIFNEIEETSVSQAGCPDVENTFQSRGELVAHLKNMQFVDNWDPPHQNGPDFIIPSDDILTWRPDGAVRLPVDDLSAVDFPPVSVISRLERTSKDYPDARAMGVKRNDQWKYWTYTEYLAEVRVVAKAFIKLGLQPFHGVGIIGFNAPEWFLSDLGAIFAGGMSTGLYTTNSAEASWQVLADSMSNLVVVEDQKQLDKILQIKAQLPHLKYIIQYVGEPTRPDVLSWSDLMEIGRTVPDQVLERRIKGVSINQCCTLVYTSGTTGEPKGVMLSHDNMTFTCKALEKSVNYFQHGVERVVSYLPLNHSAAQVFELHCAIAVAGAIYFARPDALKGTLRDTLLEVKPTTFIGVPRIWEKMYTALSEKENNLGFLSRLLLWVARRIGLKHAEANYRGSRPAPYGYRLAKTVLGKVHTAIGLEECHTMVTMAAPISQDIVKYFHSLGFNLLEGYGMSETGPHTANIHGAIKLGSVGRGIPHVEIMISSPDPTGEGEICMRGRNRFMGYFNTEHKTKECIDEDGWCHSGDLGRLDSDGFLHITGRIKELIITAGGENIAPVPIEDRIKKELPVINSCIVVGDKKKFISALLAFRTEMNPDTEAPLDKLTSSVQHWCKSVGCSAVTVEEARRSPQVKAAIEAAIIRANKDAISNAQKVQKFSIIPVDFSVAGGELGPTLKMKRHVIVQKYSDTINDMCPDN